MYISNKETMTIEKLMGFIKEHRDNEVPRFTRLENYYNAKHDILNRTMTDTSKPNNKVVNPYATYITDLYTGYFMGEPIGYNSRNEFESQLEELKLIFTYNDEQDINTQLARNASVFGLGYEIIYLDSDLNVRFSSVSPKESFVVIDDSLEGEITYGVRYYIIKDNNGVEKYRVELYDEVKVSIYETSSMLTELILIEENLHYFGIVPISVYKNDDSIKGDFECVIDLIDAYDKLTSDALNDQESFTDAYLMFSGVSVDVDDIALMKENRVITLPEGANAQWLVKNSNDVQAENNKIRLEKDIHKFSKTPNVSDESFSSNASGIAMQYKLMGTENKTSIKERKFKKGIQRRIEIITTYLQFSSNYYIDWRAVEVIFTRNLPVDETSLVDLINKLRGLVSNETLISWLPQIEDSAEEIAKKDLEATKSQQASLYNFTSV